MLTGERYIFSLVVVHDIRFGCRINLTIIDPFTYGASTLDQVSIDLLVFTVPFFTTEDIKSSVVKFGFGCPNED
ncbi:MAG: hypothetical protein OXM61_22360 [Candidatus Poribacteria bacterium]|nr:hypothetical protein [Candidatus Poribacteria bacterium]